MSLTANIKYSSSFIFCYQQKINSLPPIDSDYHEKYKQFYWATWKGYVLNPKFRDTSSLKSLTATNHWPGMKEFIRLQVENKVPINPCKADVFKDYWLEDQEIIIQRDIRMEKIWEDEWKELKNIEYK
jgi:hypothetical protein